MRDFPLALNLSSFIILSSLKQVPALGALPDLASLSSNEESAYCNWNAYDCPDSSKAQADADSEEDKCDCNAQTAPTALNCLLHSAAALLAIELCHFILLSSNV
jgi:hypothetical protein